MKAPGDPKSKMSLAAEGGSTQGAPADAHHQGAIGVQGAADRQGVHILREQGLVGERVADAAVIQYLTNVRKVRAGGAAGGTKSYEA